MADDYLAAHDGWRTCTVCQRVILKAHANKAGECVTCATVAAEPVATDAKKKTAAKHSGIEDD